MALGGGKKKSKGKTSSKGGKKDAKYITLFQILRGKEDNDDGSDNLYAKANNYKGRLIWQAFGGEEGDDEDESTFYEVQSAFVGTPHKDAPDFVVNTIVCNINNPKAAQPIDG